jgi:hypothetical protein
MSVFICLRLPLPPHCKIMVPLFNIFNNFNQTLEKIKPVRSGLDSCTRKSRLTVFQEPLKTGASLAPPSCLERDPATTVVFAVPDNAGQY